jgi:hypothetical protein
MTTNPHEQYNYALSPAEKTPLPPESDQEELQRKESEITATEHEELAALRSLLNPESEAISEEELKTKTFRQHSWGKGKTFTISSIYESHGKKMVSFVDESKMGSITYDMPYVLAMINDPESGWTME